MAMEIITLQILALIVSYLPHISSSANFSYLAVFNFGDSNSDTGGLVAGVAFPVGPPNGQTYFLKPSGRFCDGRLVIDFLMDASDLPFLNPYLDSVGAPNFQKGCNFATGGATILPANAAARNPFSFGVQISQFIIFKVRALQLLAKDKRLRKALPSEAYFKQGLYMFDVGQNDIDGAFSSKAEDQVIASIPSILAEFETGLKRLYDEGARKFWIHNTGPLGCLPRIIDTFGKDPSKLDQFGCVLSHNRAATAFNTQLHDLCLKFRGQFPDAKFTYVDVFSIKSNLIANYSQYRFKQPIAACCGYGGLPLNFDSRIACGVTKNINGSTVTATPCNNTAEYVNWDGNHYTEAANQYISSQILTGTYTDPPLSVNYSLVTSYMTQIKDNQLLCECSLSLPSWEEQWQVRALNFTDSSLNYAAFVQDAEILKSVTRVNQLKELAQILEAECILPLVVAISGRVGSESPITCELSGLRGVVVEETAEQHFLKHNDAGSWIQDSALMLSMSKEVPWYLDDGTALVNVVGARGATGFVLPVVSEIFEESGRSLVRGTLDYLQGLKMLGVKRIERLLPTGSSLTVVGEAAKDDIGTVRIQRPHKGPFYVSPKTIDQLITNLGKWARWYNYASMGLTVLGVYLMAKHVIQYILERKHRRELQKRVLAAAAKRSLQDSEGQDDNAENVSDGSTRDRLLPDLCVICLEQEYNAVFVPCGHMCCCISCSSHLTNCPLCRRRFEQSQSSYPNDSSHHTPFKRTHPDKPARQPCNSVPTHNHAAKTIEIQGEPTDEHHDQLVLEGSSHRLQAPTKTQQADHGVVPIKFPCTPNDKGISSSASSSVPIMKNGNVTKVVHEEHGRGLASNVSFQEKLNPKAPAANLGQPAKKVHVVGQSSHGQAAAKVGYKVEPESHDNHDHKRKIKEDQLSPHKKGVIVVSEQISRGGPPVDQAKSASKGNEGQENGGNKQGKRTAVDHLNDTFSDYINRAKIKIRTVSDVKDKSSSLGLDGVHDTNKREGLKDHFSDYIHRAKNKMRSTSFGTGKSTSFKRE
ncbi:hypothetical protein FNV43_RR23433 [Rhamnella rubrinervis]|uniref:RING-type E3 ubiquitin transferase n=1 Tax=Rhamnella rubrinervis TaxID=2594499 RepID=A0A8K0DTB8_9ROSA|nr:hypothetical protein FNV43_RR23433 [Rhamnella rubrinervis]